ncbi:MAG: hypothetical protein EOO77_19570 [Oxalobacteraceae bacterium]|nr:MAG: hypothetical protein EOO77_19570 [Oxalobacteraceae bacterium]
MGMADGAPLEERGPLGVTYMIVVTSEEGVVSIADRGFHSQEEAVKYCGTDSRYAVKPVLMFADASAARRWHPAQAKKTLLASLSPAQRVILGYDP